MTFKTQSAFQPEGSGGYPALNISPTLSEVTVGTVRADNGRELKIKLNLYKPQTESRPPVVVFVHGGMWQYGDYRCEGQVKGLVENSGFRACLSLLDQGVAVVTAGYRLSSEAIFPAQIHDLKGTIRFLRAQAQELGLDSDRLIVWGESAGGHLASLLGTAGQVPELEGDTGDNLNFSSAVQGVVTYFGMTDILQLGPDNYARPHIISALEMYQQADAPESSRSALFGFTAKDQGIGVLRANLGLSGSPYLNPTSPYQDQLNLAALATPLNFVSPQTCPFFIAQGGRDDRVAPAQALRLFEALQKAGVEAYLMLSAQAGHGALGQAVNRAALEFVLNRFSLRPEPATQES